MERAEGRIELSEADGEEELYSGRGLGERWRRGMG